MGDELKGISVVIRQERADSIRPILKWIKEGAPRKRERTQAASILREIVGVKDYKQLILTRGEVELLNFIYTEFPEGVTTEEQLKLL